MAEDNESRLRISAVNRTKQAWNEIRRDMSQVERASGTLRNALAGIGAGLSVAGLAAFVKSGIDVADELNKLSQRVGVSVESLSAFQFAAKLADVSSEELSVGLRQLAKNALDAQAGTGDAADAFKALRIEVAGAGGQLKGTEDLLLEVAERFSRIEDGAGKTALAMKIFGRSGAQLIPLLNAGRAGFEEFRREAERLGLIISTDTARAAERFNDDMTRLTSSFDKLKFAIAQSALPALNRFVEQLLEGQRIAGGFGDALTLFGLSTITSAKAGEKIRSIREELESLQADRERFRGFNADTTAIDQAIAALQKKLEFAKFLQRQAALEGSDRLDFGREGRGAGRAPPRETAPALPDRERDTLFQNTIRQLEQEALKVRDLTRFEEILAETQAGRYAKLAAAQKETLLNAAAAVDLAREDAQVQKEADAAAQAFFKRTAEDAKSESERLKRNRDALVDLIDPIQRFREELGKIRELLDEGLITPEQAAEAEFRINNQIEAVQGLDREIKKTTDAADRLGFTFASAFEDAIVDGEKLRDVLRGLAQDVLRILVRTTVTEPAANWLSTIFSGIIAGAAGGGGGDAIDTQHGGRRAAGDLLLVGERGPELWVPDTSGTMIPNDRLGGMGGVTIVQHNNFAVGIRGEVRAEIAAQLPRISESAKLAVFEANLRGQRV